MIERTLVTPGQLEQCLRLQAAEIDVGRPRRNLGDLMIELGFITKAQLDLALAEQRRRLKELVVGPYHIIDKLGSGGMGAVYRAQVPDTGVEVALKLLPKKWSNDPNFLSRFHREAKLGMELNHPHLVRTIDFGESKGTDIWRVRHKRAKTDPAAQPWDGKRSGPDTRGPLHGSTLRHNIKFHKQLRRRDEAAHGSL